MRSVLLDATEDRLPGQLSTSPSLSCTTDSMLDNGLVSAVYGFIMLDNSFVRAVHGFTLLHGTLGHVTQGRQVRLHWRRAEG